MTWPQDYDPLHAWPLSTLVSALPVLSLFYALVARRARVWVAALAGMLVAVATGPGRLRHAREAGRRVVRPGGRLRSAADRLDHRRVDLPVPRRRGDGPVRRDEGVDRGALVRPAAAADPDRLLLRRLPGGDRRRRGAGGDRRLVPDRPGVRPVPGRDPLPGGQHRAGGLGRRRHADPRPGGRDRPARAVAQRHGGADLAAVWRPSCRSGWCGAWSAGGETREVWPALAVSGLSFAAVQFYWSNYQESGLVDIVAALVSLAATAAFLKVWRPRTILGDDAGLAPRSVATPRSPC